MVLRSRSLIYSKTSQRSKYGRGFFTRSTEFRLHYARHSMRVCGRISYNVYEQCSLTGELATRRKQENQIIRLMYDLRVTLQIFGQNSPGANYLLTLVSFIIGILLFVLAPDGTALTPFPGIFVELCNPAKSRQILSVAVNCNENTKNVYGIQV